MQGVLVVQEAGTAVGGGGEDVSAIDQAGTAAAGEFLTLPVTLPMLPAG